MTTIQATQKRRTSPLLYPAVFLSLASLAWTTWSLVDLLGTGPIALTAAAGADIVWGAVIIAEARGLRVAGRTWAVPAVGWFTLIIVVAFLALHGIEKNNLALAAVGPFLPLGAKVIWVLALADMRDPAALTHDELRSLAEMERRMAFEEQQHRIEMRRRTMHAELVMRDVSTDFDIEVMRQDRARELNRMRPLELTATPALPELSARSDAHGEAADEHRDAPQRRVTPIAPAAPRRTGDADAPQTDEALRIEGLSKAAAVRIVRDADPTASAPQIVQRLAHHGIDADAAYVRTVLSRINRQRNATDGGYL